MRQANRPEFKAPLRFAVRIHGITEVPNQILSSYLTELSLSAGLLDDFEDFNCVAGINRRSAARL
jgi:hypothetical protein